MLLALLCFCHILILIFACLYCKDPAKSGIGSWTGNPSRRFVFIVIVYVIRIKCQIKGIIIFNGVQMDLETLQMSQGLCVWLSFWAVMKKNVAVIPRADDCGPFFLVAPACCVTVLIHWLRWSVELNILFTTNSMKHWDLCEPSQAEAQTHAPAHTRNPPGCIFTMGPPVYDYLFHCGKPDWTPADTKPTNR